MRRAKARRVHRSSAGLQDVATSGGQRGGAGGGRVVAVGNERFERAEAGGGCGQGGPVGAFVGEQGVVDVAETVCAATECGANVRGNGEAGKDFLDGTVEDG